MADSAQFGLQVPLWQAPTFPPPAASPELEVALRSAEAAWSSAHAAWWGLGISSLALGLTAITAVFTWRALSAWRLQTLGEHEFGRLLDALQALHDIEAGIANQRNRAVYQHEQSMAERSQAFRSDMAQGMSRLLQATVGLDELWGQEFKDLRHQVQKMVQQVALASNWVWEQESSMARPEHYHLMDLPDKSSSDPHDDQARAEAVRRIQEPIAALRAWLTARLAQYVVTPPGLTRWAPRRPGPRRT